MEDWYWTIEYCKVLFGYLFFMFLWPSVVFHTHLKNKEKTYHFCFCVTVQIIIVNTVILTLGLFHILNTTLVILLFYGAFLAALFHIAIQFVKKAKGSNRQGKLRLWHSAVFWIKESIWKFREKAGEYTVLIILLVFGMMYFSYGAFQLHSYGFGDLYVHHEWIYGLMEGNIFSAGVYPEAMHCFIYCLDALLGIRVYSSLLFLQGIHIAVLFISAYLLMREIFHWRYSPLLALALFLTLDLLSADHVYSIYRLQITLPLEFSLYTQFLCALFLLRYLKNAGPIKGKGKLSGYYRDENLFLFLMSVAASIMLHFYCTIMAFVLCISFAVFKLDQIFSKKYLFPLISAVLCACVIAVIPMAGALASGIPFNYSISWAIHSMDGEETRELEENSPSGELPEKKETFQILPFEKLETIYKKGYCSLYGSTRANMILCITGAVIVLCLISRKKSLKWLRDICEGYPPLILFTFLFMLIYTSPYIGLPEIISDSRFCSVGHMMILAAAIIPMDILFSLLTRWLHDMLLQILSVFSVMGIYALTIFTGHFHGYLFFELTRYNSAVEVTNSIIDTFPEKSYVLIAPTDELYPIIKYGWHEELLSFVENSNHENYALLPEHVFIYVEKKPLLYAQAYFFEGPSWLAQEKYKDIYWDKYSKKYPYTGAVQAPDITASQVSETEAQKELINYGNQWLFYTRFENRTILESKAYHWCQRFMKLHPSKMEVYYEDDAFVCYYLRNDGIFQYRSGTE